MTHKNQVVEIYQKTGYSAYRIAKMGLVPVERKSIARWIANFATDCLANWVNNVSSTGIFKKNPAATWPTGTSGIPSGWTVEDISVSSPTVNERWGE